MDLPIYDDLYFGKSEIESRIAALNSTIEAVSAKCGKYFTGTYEEYQIANAAGNIPVGCIVYITDSSVGTNPDDSESSDATSAILGVAVLGSMILG